MTADVSEPGSGQARPSAVAPAGWIRQMPLPPASPAAGLARRATRDALTAWRVAHLEETALLVVSELVTNAVLHARAGASAIALRLETSGDRLRIEIHDGDPCGPDPRTPTPLDESGFGLLLVEAMADKWGVLQTSTGKAVWAEFAIRP